MSTDNGEVRLSVLDLTPVTLEKLRCKTTSPALTEAIKRRLLASGDEVSAFQSYIDED